MEGRYEGKNILRDFFSLSLSLSLEFLDDMTPIHFNQMLFNFCCQCKYSLAHRLLAPTGLWLRWSMKLMFFPFSTSCCGLNLSVLSWPDHLSDRFLISFPHFSVEVGLPSVWPWLKLVLQCFCSFFSLRLFCLPLLNLYLCLLVSALTCPEMPGSLDVKNLDGTFAISVQYS